MIVFMEDDAGSYASVSLFMGLEILVYKAQGYGFRAIYIFPYLWNTKASFVIRPVLACRFYYMCIDENLFYTLITRIFCTFILFQAVNNLFTINYKQADR